MSVTVRDLAARAQRLADDVLFRRALATDRASLLDADLLDALADAGLYAMSAPEEFGGAGADPAELGAVTEALASGCLTTTFVWAQHQSTAVAACDPASAVHETWGRPLASGRAKAGIAFAHLRRPGPPAVTAEPAADGAGWVLDGRAPWVTGWGRVDVVNVAARHGDAIVWALIDAVADESVVARPLPLAAVNASGTVELELHRHRVPPDRIVKVEPLAEWLARDVMEMRMSGSLSLGLARRCDALLPEPVLGPRIAAVRCQLDDAATADHPAALSIARAAATALALDAAALAMVERGGAAIIRDEHAQRLGREALFLLVQAQTPAIRASQRATFGH